MAVRIPDDLAQCIGANVENIERRALEALALDAFRLERLTRPELKRLLGFGTRGELDAFLVSHGIVGGYSEAELDSDRAALQRFDL